MFRGNETRTSVGRVNAVARGMLNTARYLSKVIVLGALIWKLANQRMVM